MTRVENLYEAEALERVAGVRTDYRAHANERRGA